MLVALAFENKNSRPGADGLVALLRGFVGSRNPDGFLILRSSALAKT
jgi:hypothetical protein